MKYRNKIILLVVIQISLLLLSFIALIFFESERSLLGNSINISGKNRFLTIKAHETIDEFYIAQKNIDIITPLNDLESNINILKSGGQYDGIFIDSLPLKFEKDWNQLSKTYDEFYKTAVEMANIVNNRDEFISKYEDWEYVTDELTAQADTLTVKLAHEHELLSKNMIIFQVFLLIMNTLFHLFLVIVIVHFSKEESNRIGKSEKFRVIGELSTRIAHELRNPLSTIKMGLELIKNKENLSSSSHEKIKMIDSAIFRMTHQIDDVLDYVRITPLNSTRCKIDEIIEESIIRSNLPETIRVEFEKSSVEVECDKEKIIIVFVNLFKNAKEAMNGKGELIIKIKSLPQNLQIIIENSGPPIPSKNLDSIFLPLFTTKSTGTGLGLATCKSIISQHNGTILAVNDPTRFVITIPQKT